MLEEVHVSNLALIEDAWLEFGSGMTVLTGETGAGKTALVGALRLLLGERADSTAVRVGASEALVEGRFVAEGREVVVRRRVTADGRSRCTIDGAMATVGELAETVGPLVDLHGQHAHQALLSSSTHVEYLDRWVGGSAALALEAYREARAAYRAALERFDSLTDSIARATEDADALRHVVREIDEVSPEPDEDVLIESQLPALEHAERLSGAAEEAIRSLKSDGAALDGVAAASEALRAAAGIDGALDALLPRLDAAYAELTDTADELRAYRDRAQADPDELARLHNRLASLRGLMKRWGPRLEDVLAHRDRSRAALEVAEDSAQALRSAKESVERSRGALEAAEAELAEVRERGAADFAEALRSSTAGLGMAGAAFEIGFSRLEFDGWTDRGGTRIEILYSPGPGQPARPLAKIASGGELSRVMLALKGVLREADRVETLVFDEVDAGIGGASALEVGARLAQLAGQHQVIVVTHLAQVAACASHHLVVEKDVGSDGVRTDVRVVTGAARVGEIARLLSGDESEASLAHAREVLESAVRS